MPKPVHTAEARNPSSGLQLPSDTTIAVQRLQAFMDECPAGMCLMVGEDLVLAALNAPIAQM